MSDPAPGPTPRSRRSRRLRWGLAAGAIATLLLVSLLVVPYHAVSQVVELSAGSTAAASVVVPQAGWVTVHFDKVGGYSGMMGSAGMEYWMDGPGGPMFHHSMMRGADSYAFWSWGGTYYCGVGYTGPDHGNMSVWVNATWGLL